MYFQVVNVPTSSTSKDKLLEHQISQVRQHEAQVRALQKDAMLDLPPQIPISKDGEEGYIDSQKQLRWKRPKCNSIDQLFRAPPNRTVHDRESPPPYYSNSPSLENLEKASSRGGMRDFDEYRVLRCSSMSSNVTSPMANSHKDMQNRQQPKPILGLCLQIYCLAATRELSVHHRTDRWTNPQIMRVCTLVIIKIIKLVCMWTVYDSGGSSLPCVCIKCACYMNRVCLNKDDAFKLSHLNQRT